jgi:hypothetical protein
MTSLPSKERTHPPIPSVPTFYPVPDDVCDENGLPSRADIRARAATRRAGAGDAVECGHRTGTRHQRGAEARCTSFDSEEANYSAGYSSKSGMHY